MSTKMRFYLFVVLLLALCGARLATAAELPDFKEIVRAHSPAVVKIIVQQNAARADQQLPGPEEIPEELRRFFFFFCGVSCPHRKTPSICMEGVFE